MKLRIGTRASALALWQARHVRQCLMEAHPDLDVELVPITTQGDRILDRSLAAVGGKGLFVKEIEAALLDRRVDIAVHSVKDLPADMPEGLMLAAIPLRADPRDALVSREGGALEALPKGARIGTSSLRRRAQLLHARPDLQMVNLRGNVDTRLRKVAEAVDRLDGAILALAGLQRLGLDHHVSEALSVDCSLPAVGQGALGIQAREDDADTRALLEVLHHPESATVVRAERALLALLAGSCHLPIAALAVIDAEGALWLRARIGTPDGARLVEREGRGDPASPEVLAERVATALLEGGGREILDAVRAPTAAPVDGAPRPLDGVRVIVTRSRDRASGLSEKIRALGGVPEEVAAIAIVPAADPEPLREALLRLREGAYDWVVFTSANGVEHTFQQMAAMQLDASLFRRVHVAVVGAQTAQDLRAREVSVDLVPTGEKQRAEGLLAALIAAGVGKGSRCLLPVAESTRPVLVEGLRATGATADPVVAYRTEAATEDRDRLHALLAEAEGYVTFGSGSAVRHFVSMLDAPGDALARWRIACIGPITARVAYENNLTVDVLPSEASFDALVKQLVAHVEESRG